MDSKASMSKSAIPCIDYSSGLSLNRRALQCWLERKNMRMGRLAKLLKISPRKLRWKLYKNKKFRRKEITALIYVMGAWQALRVLWFPTIEEKRRIIGSKNHRRCGRRNGIGRTCYSKRTCRTDGNAGTACARTGRNSQPDVPSVFGSAAAQSEGYRAFARRRFLRGNGRKRAYSRRGTQSYPYKP